MPKHRKSSDHTGQNCCMICTDQIDYYAIGECGHNEICWKCTLKQRHKLLKKECPYCKQTNYKVLITKDKKETLDKCLGALFDPEQDIYY